MHRPGYLVDLPREYNTRIKDVTTKQPDLIQTAKSHDGPGNKHTNHAKQDKKMQQQRSSTRKKFLAGYSRMWDTNTPGYTCPEQDIDRKRQAYMQ